ncbi:MAG: FAD-dependent oxidoreductase [Candidatus Promineofilum sp.]|nr:FAD-dependent oxidoreductase [Promineifilum sp.]MBP9657645.1 FAD-dependent oxidoreductase [Promineifilum sp.]
MAKPVILALDDEPQVLNAVGRDLRTHFGNDYRIVSLSNGKAALEALDQLKQRNTPVALFLVDQRMPEMTGVEFLAEAQRVFPDARKVLLTAYADTEAAIASINRVGLDYYLMKPWDPPEEHLYPVLDDLLGDWWATHPLPFEGIRVAGTLWSPSSHHVKDFLARNRIPYQWLDLDKDAEARATVETLAGGGGVKLPVVFFPDGTTLIEPNLTDLAMKAGLQTSATAPFYDLIIIGGGPAGLGAAVYGASEGLSTVMIERQATGGQAGTSSRIENYLGFPKGLSGSDLATRAVAQARRLGAEILTAREVVGVRVEDPYRYVMLNDGTELGCRALVVAGGVTNRRLDAPGVERLTGAGIYYGAALTEAAFYRGEHMCVIGGANSAGQGAMFFSRYGSKVSMLVRSSSLSISMSQYLIDQIADTPNIEVLTRRTVTEVHGQNRLEAISVLNQETNELSRIDTPALFLFIGAVPHSAYLAGVVERNSAGFILTGPDLLVDGKRPKGWKPQRDPFLLETSVPGIFAAGDVRNGATRRVAAAVGEGANVISQVHQYLQTV